MSMSRAEARYWVMAAKEKNFPPLTGEAAAPEIAAQCDEQQRTLLDEYFAKFAAMQGPPEQEECIACHWRLSLEWAIQHGQARCVYCGYPYRVYHYDLPGAAAGGRLIRPLPYHPSGVTVKHEGEHD